MNETLPPTKPVSQPVPASIAIAGATLVLLVALAAGGYVLRQEIVAMRDAKPVAPPEVTQALDALQSAMEKQRSDYSAQLGKVQEELSALQAKQDEQPSLEANLAPLQAQLDMIAAKLEETRAPAPAAVEPAPAPVVEAAPVTVPPVPAALRRAVDSGEPYGDALASAREQISPATASTLEIYAADGVATEAELRQRFALLLESKPVPTSTAATKINDSSWAGRTNRLFGGLITIKRAAPVVEPVSDAYATLRDTHDVSLKTLTTRVRDLPAVERASFADWLEAADAHLDVTEALGKE